MPAGKVERIAVRNSAKIVQFRLVGLQGVDWNLDSRETIGAGAATLLVALMSGLQIEVAYCGRGERKQQDGEVARNITII